MDQQTSLEDSSEHQAENNSQEYDLTKYIDLAPSSDYKLNSFLIEISDALTSDDLRKLKFLCEGKYGIGKAKLERITCPLDLFTTLREMGLLNKTNMITLQAMLWTVQRRDLQKRYIKFVESLGSSIHFFVPKETPENGYEFVEFHIKGEDLNTFDKPKLEKVRHLIASLLNVPEEFVIISGIEPSKSLRITIMLLKDDALRLISKPPDSLEVLSDISIDKIIIGTTTISVSAERKPVIEHHPAEDKMDKDMAYVLFKHSQVERELNIAHTKISKLESKLNLAESVPKNASSFLYLLVLLIQQIHDHTIHLMKLKRFIDDHAFNPIDKLQKKCAFTYFRHCLSKVKQLGYKEDIVVNLLDAQALVFQWHKHERMGIEIARLKMELAITAWERDKLAFYHQLGVQDKIMSTRDEFCISLMTQNIPVPIAVGFNTKLSPECVEHVFRRLSQDVTESEFKTLIKKHQIKGQTVRTVYDYLTTKFNQQLSQAQGADFRSFVTDVLATPLNRSDFLRKLDSYVSEFYATSKIPQSKGVYNKKEGSPSTTPNPQAKSLQEMNERLSNIEKCLQQREGSPYGKFNSSAMLDNFLKSNQLFVQSFLPGNYDSQDFLSSLKIE